MARGCVSDDELAAYIEGALPPDERAAFDAHCAACDACRALLAAGIRVLLTRRGDSTPPERPAAAAGGRPRLPVVLPASYELGEEIARGGLGRVLRARDQRLGRVVAIKELQQKSRQAEERFVREALITARLEHPAIVPVHEAGSWPDGDLFYAMKLVSGETLAARIRCAGGLHQRLALLPSVLAVAEAMAYAHSRGVIHRDLKPLNVLCGQFGETVVVDWGLAKDLRATGPAFDTLANAGAPVVLGTPPYMPPEQARGEAVDERADVYALGAILYEVLSGVPPYKDSAPDVLAALLSGPPAPLETLERGAPRDLLALVRKAMARDPADRYPSARELAVDLEQFTTGQLVGAHEYSRWALLQRWLRHHRLPVTVAAVALAVVVGVGAVSLANNIRARRAARAAQALAENARAETEARNFQLILEQARAVVDGDPTRALALLKLLPSSAALWGEGRAVALLAVSRGYARHVWRGPGNQTKISFSPDGRWLVACGTQASARVADATTGDVRPLGLGGPAIVDIYFAADGQLVASGDDGTIAVFSAAGVAGSGEPPRFLRRAGAPDRRTLVAISPDARRVASTTEDDSTVVLWDVASGATRTLAGSKDGARDIAFSPDGRAVATISVDRVLRLFDTATGAARELTGSDVSSRLVFSKDGARVLTSELSGIREWTLATGASRVLPFPRQRYIAVAVSPDGGTVAAAGFEGPVHLLDAASGETTTLRGHGGLVTYLTFSPDGRLLASASMDHTDRLWQVPERKGRVLGHVEGTAAHPVFSPDGSTVAVGSGDGTISLFPVAGGEPRRLRGHTGAVFDARYAPDGRTLASQSMDRTVRMWDLATGQARVIAETAPWVDFGRLGFSPDGRFLAASLDLTTLAVVEPASGARVCTFDGEGFNLAHAFGPDRHTVAFTSNEQVILADLATCARRILYSHDRGKSAYQLVFSEDGHFLASASDDSTVGLHDLATGATRRLAGHEMMIGALAFAPDGKTLASGSGDRTVRLWDVASGRARTLQGHETLVTTVTFSPDGRTLASSGLDGAIRLWDVGSGAGGLLLGHTDRVMGIAFSPDGKLLVSGSRDGTVRLWPADPLQGLPVDPAELEARLETLTSARIDAENRVTSP